MSHHEPINELPLEIGESTEATKEGKEIEKIENDLDLMNEVLGEEDGLLGENDLLDENEMDIDEQEARAFWDDITEDVANAEAENEDVGEDFQELTDGELEKEAEDKEDAGEQVAVDESETQIGRKEEGKMMGRGSRRRNRGQRSSYSNRELQQVVPRKDWFSRSCLPAREVWPRLRPVKVERK